MFLRMPASARWVVLAAVLCAPPAAACPWESLFDGKKLGRWEVVQKFDFIHHGKVEVKDATLVLGIGRPGTAVRYQGKFPRIDYEISLEAMRVEGDDFFCCLTFPVGLPSQQQDRDAAAGGPALSLVVGGWGGTVVGLSLIDGEPAAENQTCSFHEFRKKQWYNIRVRVTRSKVEAWIGKEKVVDFQTKDHRLSIYFEPESALPLGIATWRTTGAVRNIRVRRLGAEELRKGASRSESPPPTAAPGGPRR
jgi:hypothetical protein